MTQFRNLSIRKKILLSMLAFTLVPIILVASVAVTMTYRTMRDQLIYDHRMSSGWLQSRLSLDMGDTLGQFYEFEVDKDAKADILSWCTKDRELDYEARWRLITVMNTIISMDSRLNAIELYNYALDEVLIAERSGAYVDETGDRLAAWQARPEEMQTNLVYLRSGREILACHQIFRFDDNLPIALVVMHLRPYQLQDILDEIKTVPEETILVFNDQDELLEADCGTDWDVEDDDVAGVLRQLAEGEKKEASFADRFWFYRSVDNGKMQILLTVPNRTIVAALRPTVLSGVIVALLGAAASVICSVIYSRAVSRPIISLSHRMKSLTLNQYFGSVAENRGDEIGVLQSSFDHMIARNQELIAQEYQSKLEKRNAQLRALQAQINPHFLYNTLQVIGGMALQKNAPEIYQVTLALSDILRYSLNFSREMVSLEEELRYLRSYVTIQNERFGGRIRLETDLAPETVDCVIPKLILQPLVENSFEHGLPEKPGDWVLTVESRLEEGGDLLLRVRDNGVGFSRERLEEIRVMLEKGTDRAMQAGSHIGLANVDARIRLRCPAGPYGVFIDSVPGGGTTVSVRMQAEREAHEP